MHVWMQVGGHVCVLHLHMHCAWTFFFLSIQWDSVAYLSMRTPGSSVVRKATESHRMDKENPALIGNTVAMPEWKHKLSHRPGDVLPCHHLACHTIFSKHKVVST
jgi:hypothetical protein